MKKQRKHYTAEEKVAILRRRLLENVAVSDLCEERGLQPTVFYRWQKEFFENGAAAFEQKGCRNHQAEQERIEYLTKKIQTKARSAARSWSGLTSRTLRSQGMESASTSVIRRPTRKERGK